MLNYSSNTTKADSLQNNLIGWITNLQGTGNPELNDIVNELNRLRYQIGNSKGDDVELSRSITRLQNKVKNVATTSKSLHSSCLREIQQHLQSITKH